MAKRQFRFVPVCGLLLFLALFSLNAGVPSAGAAQRSAETSLSNNRHVDTLAAANSSYLKTPGSNAGAMQLSSPAQQDASITFTQTGQTLQGRFLQYWQNHGGLAQMGYPLTPERHEISDIDGKAYTMQYFERAVFELHPENQPPYDVLLSLLGDILYKQKYPDGAPGQTPNTSPGSVLFPQTGKRLGGVFLQYWQSHGALMQQGYPISDEFTEVSALNGKPYTVQYFERAVFELHPENQPPYNVLLSQLGTYRMQGNPISGGGATRPLGITAVNNFEPGAKAGSLFVGSFFDDRTYTNPNIAGLTFRTSWADIEPTEGNFVWEKLDTVFNNAETNGKWVELVLIPGFGTPAWALQGVQTATFSVIYGPGQGQHLLLPLPWDQTYLSRWFAFLQAVSDRYQNRSSFLKIAADGPTSVTAEMSLPNAPADLCTWLTVGYTSDRLIGAWTQVFSNYARIFPHQYFSLALYPPLPIVSTTRCDNGNLTGTVHSESQRVTAAIIALGVDNYPRQFVLQENGMTAAKENTAILGAYDVVKSYGGKVVIGFQLVTSAMLHPTDMGDPDGATALQKSLQRGVDAHAQFLEVWEPDVLDPAAQNVLAAIAGALGH
jgi:hypothetical protein